MFSLSSEAKVGLFVLVGLIILGYMSVQVGKQSLGLKKGYTLEYFGQLRQRGMAVYVWKVSSSGAPDDVLVRLWVKDGKVGGVTAQ